MLLIWLHFKLINHFTFKLCVWRGLCFVFFITVALSAKALCFLTQISNCSLAFSLVETTVRFYCEII